MKNTVTVTNANGDSERITLPNPIWEGSDEIGTGLTRKAIYIGPRTKRVIVETYSIWEDRLTHGCIGTRYHEVTEQSQLAAIAGEYDKVAVVLEATGLLVPAEL